MVMVALGLIGEEVSKMVVVQVRKSLMGQGLVSRFYIRSQITRKQTQIRRNASLKRESLRKSLVSRCLANAALFGICLTMFLCWNLPERVKGGRATRPGRRRSARVIRDRDGHDVTLLLGARRGCLQLRAQL